MNASSASHGKENFLRFLIDELHYVKVKVLPDGRVVGLLQFMFTFGIVVNIDPGGYEYRYCYPDRLEAFKDFNEWDGEDEPTGQWIKRKGRADDHDYLNPNYEGMC